MKENAVYARVFTGLRNLRTGRIVSRNVLGPQLGCLVFAKNDDLIQKVNKAEEALVRYDVVLSSDRGYLELYAPVASR